MKLLLILILSTSLYSETVKQWDIIFQNLDYKQRSSLVKTFVKSIPFDLHYSLTAIHLKESHAGKYKININDGTSIDVGDFMINTKEYNRKRKIKNTKWNTARAIEELEDYETNYLEALTILLECHKKSNKVWKTTYRYYNGWTSGSKASYKYSKDIANIIKVLRKYFNNPNIIKER